MDNQTLFLCAGLTVRI